MRASKTQWRSCKCFEGFKSAVALNSSAEVSCTEPPVMPYLFSVLHKAAVIFYCAFVCYCTEATSSFAALSRLCCLCSSL
eukprot:655531-Pelagomonas_calceolata.AAC.7